MLKNFYNYLCSINSFAHVVQLVEFELLLKGVTNAGGVRVEIATSREAGIESLLYRLWQELIWDSLLVAYAKEILADRLVLKYIVKIGARLLDALHELHLEVLVGQ